MLDNKKVQVYAWMVKTKKITINELPIEYREAVTNALPYFNVVDLDRITALEEQYNYIYKNTSELNDNFVGFVDFVFDQFDWS